MTFFLSLLFMFLVFWRPQDWLLPFLYGWPILDVILFVTLLALLLEVNSKRVSLPREVPQLWLLPALFGATLMSHVAHGYFAGFFETLPETFKICFFTFLLIVVLNSSNKLRAIAWLFVGMAVFMTVHALLQQNLGYGFAGQRPIYQWRVVAEKHVVRSLFFGIFEDPNDMAQFIVCSMPFAFVLFRRANVGTFLVGCGIVAFLFRGYASTDSRGGLVALVVMSCLMLISLLKPKAQRIVLFLLVLGGIAVFPLAGTFLDESAHDRAVFWGDANRAFKGSPIFGVGYGLINEYIQESRSVHSAFVWCYSSIGVFGYWFWFGLLFAGVSSVWRTLGRLSKARTADEKWLRRFANMSLASFGGFMASAYFLSRAFVYPLFFLVAILAAIWPVCERQAAVQHNVHFSPYDRKRFVMQNTVLSLASIAYIYVSILILNKVW